MDPSQTVTAPRTDDLTRARAHLMVELNDARRIIAAAAALLPDAVYQDPSRLGADRARLDVASRLVNEVACAVGDLTFRPAADSGEEG